MKKKKYLLCILAIAFIVVLASCKAKTPDVDHPEENTQNKDEHTENNNPGENTGNDNPGENTGNDNPGENTGNDNPGENTGNDNPGENTGNDNPGENTGNDNPGETENVELNNRKTEAATELSSYATNKKSEISHIEPTSKHLGEIDDEKTKALALVQEATSLVQIEEILEDAKGKIDECVAAVKEELNELKGTAKEDLDSYVAGISKEYKDSSLLQSITNEKTAAYSKIDNAATKSKVTEELTAAKASIEGFVRQYLESCSGSIEVVKYAGDLESAYLEWSPVLGASSYNVYYKEKDEDDSKYKSVDDILIRKYASYYRADVLGLKAGTYYLKVTSVTNEIEGEPVIRMVTVLPHDRSGFGFVMGTGAVTKVKTNTSSGAYNDDGTLKNNAVVLYVTNKNKDKITYNQATGLQAILTNLRKTSTPIDIRMIGEITDFAEMEKGDLLVDALTCGVTIEGVGNDATANGWGLRIKNSSNVEVRNLGFMNCNSDEGDDVGLQQGNDHIWVHNCDFFYGDAGSDADQVKGDGALDTKTSSYVTHSYNHFYDTGKSNLQGMKSESTENCITYHHNWYDHSDSRHPRIRTCTVHIYNNYFDGNAKYGVGMTMGGSAFVEANYFRSTATMKPMLNSGQGTDAKGEGTFSGENGGVIKAYNNDFDGQVSFVSQKNVSNNDFDAYVVETRDEKVPTSVVAIKGGTSYNNFDTASDFYSYTVDTPQEAKAKVEEYAGRVEGGDFKWQFDNATQDGNYSVIAELKEKLTNYKTTLLYILGEGEEEIEETKAEDVIAAIDALPSKENVTNLDRTAIEEAKALYDSLSYTEQVKVTNSSKLIEVLEALENLPQGPQILTFESGANGDNPFFTVTGNLKSGASPLTYNGVTYNKALKMESATKITFTLKESATITIVTDGKSAGIKINSTKKNTNENGILTMQLSAGSYVIEKGDGMNLYAIIIN